jgi:hypothetical protein
MHSGTGIITIKQSKMKTFIYFVLAIPLLSICSGNNPDQKKDLQIQLIDTTKSVLCERINVPSNYQRIESPKGSFAYFLQHLELKSGGTEVRLFDGSKKSNQNVHAAIINIDVGTRDLQQCADAVMRLRAEYLFEQKKYHEISFNFVSDGKPRFLKDYCSNKLDYTCFRKYMNYVFSYANTRSLYHQLNSKTDFGNIAIGDVLIQTGNPYGHAVIVVDMAKEPQSGDIVYLLAQSYMPAQDIHVVKNPTNKLISPWYQITDSKTILTPEWTFYKQDLRSFE